MSENRDIEANINSRKSDSTNKTFFSVIYRMRDVNRWALMRNTIYENVSEHSLDTAIIAHALAIIKNECFNGNINEERVALLALFHDATEVLTGDLPTPVKYFSKDIKSAYAEIEKTAQNKLIDMLPDFLQDKYSALICPKGEDKELLKIVKAADKISALIKCIQERNMGNKEFISAEKSTKKAIIMLNLPEADYFLENFLPAYSLTLDEQQ